MRYALLLLATAAFGDTILFPAAGELTPRQTLTGDINQLYVGGAYGSSAAASLSCANSGVCGGDEGASTLLADGRIFIMTGDIIGGWIASTKTYTNAWRTNCTIGTGTGLCLGIHGMALYSQGTNFDACHEMENLRASLGQGSTQSSTCPAITWIEDTTHTTTEPAVAYPIVPQGSGESVGAGMPPTGMFAVGNNIYLIQQVVKTSMDSLAVATRSAFYKSSSTASITATAKPTWTRIVTLSQYPTIPTITVSVTNGSTAATRTAGTASSTTWADADAFDNVQIGTIWHSSGTKYRFTVVSGNSLTLNQTWTGTTGSFTAWILPKQEVNAGKFMETSCEVMTEAQINGVAWGSRLPTPLQAGDVVFCWGAGIYRRSNIYLMAFAANQTAIDAATYGNGLSNAYYLTGLAGDVPTWTVQDEDSAIPLQTSRQFLGTQQGLFCVGEHSIRFYPQLKNGRFVHMYGSAECGGIMLRSSAAPWGDWSHEQRVMVNTNYPLQPTQWHAQFVHNPGDVAPHTNFTTLPPVYDPDGVGCPSSCPQFNTTSATLSPWEHPGNVYGPYQLPSVTATDKGATIVIHTLISTFNPYQIFQASVEINKNTYNVVGRTASTGRTLTR